jgi:hypothetical protein
MIAIRRLLSNTNGDVKSAYLFNMAINRRGIMNRSCLYRKQWNTSLYYSTTRNGASEFGKAMIRSHTLTIPNIIPGRMPYEFHYSWSSLSGHLSFVLMAASYGYDDIIGLRSLAVAAGFSMLAFNYWHPRKFQYLYYQQPLPLF